MKTVAVFVKNLTSGGAEKQAVLLAKAISDTYKTHFIIFNSKKVHKKYLDLLKEDKNIIVNELDGSHIARYVAFVKLLRNEKIEQIYSYLTAANLYACSSQIFCKVKTITGLRNAQLPYLKKIADKLMTNLFAVKTVANCYSGKDNFCKEGFLSEKIEVIPNCFENISPYKQKGKNDIVEIITVGRFVDQKDYETAIKSISLLKGICNNFHFTIIGYGYLEKQIRNWLKIYSIDDITDILLNPDNIHECLDKSDIYLSTSLFEGTSNSIMEGMNANLPIVATDVGDNSRLVVENQNGFIVPVKDAEKIAKVLSTLIEDEELRNRMGKCSKSHLLANYSVSIFKEKYCHLVESI